MMMTDTGMTTMRDGDDDDDDGDRSMSTTDMDDDRQMMTIQKSPEGDRRIG